ncbi:MAG: MlaD family protein [Alloprevotella sp.]
MKNEIKIAITAIVCVAILIVGINFLKGINIFQSTNSYYVKLKDSKQLAVSNLVYANGYPVGTIRDIEYNYADNSAVVVLIELDKNMRIPKGTTASLETPLMGGVIMHLVLGQNPTDLLEPQDTILGANSMGAMDQLSTMMPTVEAMLPKLDSILTNLNRLTGDPALQQTLSNAAEITENLKHTSAELDKLMANQVKNTLNNAEQLTGNLAKADVEGTMTNLNSTVADARLLVGQLQATMADVQRQLTGTDGTLGALMNDRALYDNLNHTLQSADSLVTDLKAHPKRYVHFSLFGRKDK